MIAKFFIKTIFVSLLTFSTIIQTPSCACCSSQYNKFDFWVGDWLVKNRNGKILGMSEIRKLEDNCLVSEKWIGNDNFSGRSYNYFDPEEETWNQLWISNTGNILKLKGQLENNKMILTSTWQSGIKGSYKNQIIWTPKEDGTVTQEWVLLFKEDNRRDTLFVGIYHKRE